MSAIDLIIFNLEEVRRRSIKIWKAIPDELLNWKPDETALTCLEMIRHVLEAEHYYHLAILNKASLVMYDSPFEKEPLVSVEKELNFAQPFREKFIDMIKGLNSEDLFSIKIDRSDVGYIRTLDDMLLRIAYHESVHTGQLPDYLRTAEAPRADVWD